MTDPTLLAVVLRFLSLAIPSLALGAALVVAFAVLGYVLLRAGGHIELRDR